MNTSARLGGRLGVVSAVVGCVLRSLGLTKADPDLWGHVRFGQLIVSAAEVPRLDPFSYLTAGQVWINHEWMSEVLFALAYRIGGPAGLVALKILVGLTIFSIVYLHLARRGLDLLRAGMVVVLLVLVLQIGVVTVRPHVFTYLFFFVVVLAIEAADRGSWKRMWALPPIFVLWANLHGGFLAGLGVLGAWTVTRGCLALWQRYQRQDQDTPPVMRSIGMPIGILLASVLATTLNPYGVELLLFLVRTATVPRPEISEWQPVQIGSVMGLAYLAFLTLVVLALVRSSRPRSPAAMVVLALTGVAPLLAVRHLPLFGLAGVAIAGEHLGAAFGRRDPKVGGSRRLDHGVAVVGTLVGLALVLSVLPRMGCIELDDRYPVAAVRALEDSGATGNLAVSFTWGEYALWHLAPDLRVSMDGRRETVYSEPIYAEHLQFLYGTGSWDDLLERRPTDAALVERGGPTFNLLSLKPGWTLVYSDSLAAVFAREGWPGAEMLRAQGAAPEPVPPCFP